MLRTEKVKNLADAPGARGHVPDAPHSHAPHYGISGLRQPDLEPIVRQQT
jgi:hypothetical protein